MTACPPLIPGSASPAPVAALPLAELTRDWVSDRPVVSVLCPTFEQRTFVEDAVNSFLGQRTDFPFEIIIRDDASTDGTADIVAEFARNYPGVIRAILEPRNRYPDVDPFSPLIQAARGEYVALCEGDDYWIDPLKLSKQVELLERTGAAASHHSQIEIQDGFILAPTDLTGRNRRDRPGHELMTSKKSLLTRTIVVRRDIVDDAARNGLLSRMWAVDAMITAIVGTRGGSLYADVWPAVYRVHQGGISTLLKLDSVVSHARKSVDMRHIGAYLRSAGFREPAVMYLEQSRKLSSAATVGLIADVPRLVQGRQFRTLIRRGQAVGAATTPRSIRQQVWSVARAAMRRGAS